MLLGGFGVRTERISFILGVGHADEKYNGTLTSFAFDVALSYELGRVHAFYTSIVGSLLVDLIPDEVNDDDDAQMRGGGSLSFGYRYLPAKHSAFGFGVGAFGRVTSPYREFVCAGFGVELKALFQHGLFRLELFASPGLNINAELPRYYARLPLFAMGMGFRAGAAI
ncbi:MAG: hypothetical protein CSA65_01635 [Proteobacteria bacterium]|nr:MAG: hypothetical protein CSA65_01635 [Pseudomonadota bacterium]